MSRLLRSFIQGLCLTASLIGLGVLIIYYPPTILIALVLIIFGFSWGIFYDIDKVDIKPRERTDDVAVLWR